MTLSVIPAPDRIETGSGTLAIGGGLWPQGEVERDWLRLGRRRLASWGLLDPDGTDLTIGSDPGLAAGGYRIRIDHERVAIRIGDQPGLAHALGVLVQLLPPGAGSAAGARGPLRLPEVELESSPRYAYRGAMIDLSRHFFPKPVLRDLIEVLAVFGYNRLHLHLTDDQGWRVESRIEPRLTEIATHRRGTRFGPGGNYDPTPYGGYLTLSDLRELTDYGRECGIELVAEVDLPGHSTALRAAIPELGRPGEQVEVLQTVGWGGSSIRPIPGSLEVLCRLLDELCDETGIRHVHLGGDECDMSWWSEDPEVERHRIELGLDAGTGLHGWLLRELGRHLRERDVTVLAWDEAFVTDGLVDGAVVTAWRGDAVAERAAAAHPLVRAPLYPTYFNFDQSADADEPRAQGGPITLRDVMGFEPAPEAWSQQARDNVLGGQFNVWTEWITDRAELEYAIFPRGLAMAEVLWRGSVADPDDLERRIAATLPLLDARGIGYRPLDGPRPWQKGGDGRRRRATGNDIAATRRWVESVSDRA